MRRRIPDISRINDLIGWNPSIALDDTIADIIKQFKEDGLSDTITELPNGERVVVDWSLALAMPKSLSTALTDKIQNKEARVGIIGLGYVGLPLAVEFAQAGYHVVGIDTESTKSWT